METLSETTPGYLTLQTRIKLPVPYWLRLSQQARARHFSGRELIEQVLVEYAAVLTPAEAAFMDDMFSQDEIGDMEAVE